MYCGQPNFNNKINSLRNNPNLSKFRSVQIVKIMQTKYETSTQSGTKPMSVKNIHSIYYYLLWRGSLAASNLRKFISGFIKCCYLLDYNFNLCSKENKWNIEKKKLLCVTIKCVIVAHGRKKKVSSHSSS